MPPYHLHTTIPIYLHTTHLTVFLPSTEYLVQFEEDRWEPGRWQNLSVYEGKLNSVTLQLSPYLNYQFRVLAINAVGPSTPSLPSFHYLTSGAR